MQDQPNKHTGYCSNYCGMLIEKKEPAMQWTMGVDNIMYVKVTDIIQ
jgi:hypothetical protein